ncbi:chondroitin sulfate proteoglycan 4 [Tachyglossus aculeatus]|uniref:chondroitin sulfate proteoglycan 4 n=1 Tax=Tachyglossus aculeatus TaxID=9261 RepID=UPI0018F2CC2B|nr:chondroitin sulfate proteoglycan 4 [Tachyglossus aculeatus]
MSIWGLPAPRVLLQLCLWTLSLLASPASGASFFGEDHLQVPLVEALDTIHLHLQFLTAQEDGLFLLAAGQPDHLLVELRSGGLQVRLAQGSEQVTLQSPAGQQFDDLVAHDVVLTVRDGQATLSLDSLLNSSARVSPGPLRMSYGLFLGGPGSLDLPYLTGTSPPFRGCLLTATLNGQDLLSPRGPDCSPEFSAGEDEPLGFLGPRSLAAFPGWDAREEGTIEFTLTTRARRAPLVFQAGPQGDFVYLEVFEGHLRGVVEKGHGAVLLHNNVPVSDGQPHEVSVRVDVYKLEISVDQYPTRTSNRGVHSYLDLQGRLLLGGLDAPAARRLREHRLGLAPDADASLVGCVEDLLVNSERRSLRDAVVTRDLAAGCAFPDEDEDEAYNPYEPLAGPEPCRPEPGLPPAFANFTRLLNLSPLEVGEGGTAWLEWRHVQPALDLPAAGIRQSQVLFGLARAARHGELELDIPGAQARKKFTLLDVVNRKVRFAHDGSEEPADQLALEVTVTARGPLPECLRRGQTYLLPIKVSPVNDPPQVVFPHGSLMVILEHTRKALGPDVFQAHDPDSPCQGLTFQLLGAARLAGGRVESDARPGVPVADFTCGDLEVGRLAYVHQSGPAQDLMLQVSDGQVSSPVATLKVIAIQPDIQLRNNTGLFVAQGASAPITTTNLSAETNAVQQQVSILYRLTQPPLYGEVQKPGAMAGQWEGTQVFLQRDLEQGQVRYLSTDPRPLAEDATEKLRFEVRVGQQVLENNTFLVTIRRAAIRMLRLEPLLALQAGPVTIGPTQLEATLEDPAAPSPIPFHYQLVMAPKKGNLRLRGARLSEGQGFTQEDLREGHLSYGATSRASQEANDAFQFRVTSAAHFSPLYTLPILISGDPDAPILTNVLLSVPEGGEAVISRDHLFVRSLHGTDYLYEVIEKPRHGKLAWRGAGGPAGGPSGDGVASGDVGTSGGGVSEGGISGSGASGVPTVTQFTNDDLLRGRLVYRHDGSETTEDDIPFVAARQGEGSAGTAWEDVRGVFRVSIQPVNDHAPVRVVHRVLDVVRHGRRLLTTADIAFADADSGFSDTHLVFTRKDLLFGRIVAAADPARPVYRFTQDDLRQKRILFIHSGADRGSIQLQVSDGLHQSTSLLDVRASDPYLRLANGSGLAVRQGGQGTIDSTALSLETNMDVRGGEEIQFRVTSPPRRGTLLKGGQPAAAFSQQDVQEGALLYRHDGSRAPRDHFDFSVQVGPVALEDTLQVTVFLDVPLGPLTLARHEKIYVFQGEAAEIKPDHLEAVQEAIPPQDISYTVTSSPRAGHLATISPGANLNESPSLDSVRNFTQKDIDEGRILYLHTRAESWTDQFTVDVLAEGAGSLAGVVVELEVLPITIPLEVGNVTVAEGEARALSPAVLRVPGPYFPTLPLVFHVLDRPQHGTLRHAEHPTDDSLDAFTWREVEQQLILYVHDGSETRADSFTLLANVSEIDRQSRPAVISVTVLPRNDEVPVVTVNPGLQMWEGTTVAITPEMLRSEDEDSPPEDLLYTIEQPTNGKVLLRSSPSNEVRQFTQAQINSGLVQFAHEGSLEGGFRFDVSDGENISPGHFFSVKAQKQLHITAGSIQALMVCPGTFQPITSQNLKAETNEGTDAHQLLFSVEQPPRLGRLVNSRLGRERGELINFTQAEVDSGMIFYEHDMPPEPFWLSEDALGLRVSSPPARSLFISLPVTVSFEANCPQRATRLWRNEGLWVPEGQSAEINQVALDASNLLAGLPKSQRPTHDVVFLVTEFPAHGELSVAGEALGPSRPYFLQSDLAAGRLAYTHRGGGTQPDRFRFRAQLRAGARGSGQPPEAEPGATVAEAFNITVRDVNEKPPWPQEASPLQVLRGSWAVLSRDHLSVVDPDSTPEEIQYQVRRGPLGGFLAPAGDPGTPLSHFTQADVDAGLLVFVANGSSSEGSFQLSVSDGASPPVPATLTVLVLPTAITVVSRTPLEVPQGLNQAPLTRDHLLATSDQEEPDAFYRITEGPRFGLLMVGGRPVEGFSQRQVDWGEVAFTFTNFTSAQDAFGLLVRARGANGSAALNLTVRPLVWVRQGASWPRGTTLRVDRGVLDASELANLTGSVPGFRVLQAPRNGQLVRASGGTPLDAFTQKDLEEGLIGLELAEAEEGSPTSQDDSITLELTARGVPPAVVSLAFATEPYNSSRPYGVQLLRGPQAAGPSGVPRPPQEDTASRTVSGPKGPERPTAHTGQPDVPPTGWRGQDVTTEPSPTQRGSFLRFVEANMFSVIIPICLILLLLALILPLLFYLRKRNKTGQHNVQGISAKPRNGTVPDQEMFRKTDPGQGIPLTPVPPKGREAGGQQDPELLQFCRTPNPALKNNQYWV